MDRYYFLCTMLMIALVAQTDFSQGAISITGNSELGGGVAVACIWNATAADIKLELTISQQPNTMGGFYYQKTYGTNFVANGTQDPTRFAVDNVTADNSNLTMRISNLQCSDEKNYYCIFKFGTQGTGNSNYRNETEKLVIKAPPRSPSLMVSDGTTEVMEQANINVVCNANIGRPGRGSMQWKIDRSGNLEVIRDDDKRIISKQNATLQSGDVNCTQRQEQTFKMQVNRTDQNLMIACFVTNVDFPPDQTPYACQNPTTELCNKTETFTIFYGVTNNSMTVYREPHGNIYQGMTVNLFCQAAGFPAPNYTWIKIGDENKTLTWSMVGDKSRLTLTNVVNVGDQGETYRCIASNSPLGTSYYASSDINFVILMTTTTTTTTTTTPLTTPTSSTKTDGTGRTDGTGGTEPQNGGNGNDPTNTIIIVVVVVGSVLIIAIVIGVVCWKKRSHKQIEEPSEKPYNNRTNLSFQNPQQQQPDLVADKKFQNPTVDNNMYNKSSLSGSSPSFSEKKEDGLMYADLTYDNKPRSRKPMAITDSSSDYSDIQMPQV